MTDSSKGRNAIDADGVLEWANATATRWLRSNPQPRLGQDSAPSSIAAAAHRTIERTASAMAKTALRVGGECSTDANAISGWLATCADAVAEPKAESLPHRLTGRLSNAEAPDDRNLARWTAALRENTQAAGVGWLRGRDTGDLEFTIAKVGGRWSVVEHGWPRDQQDLRTRVIRAAAAAITRHASQLGHDPASYETLVKAFETDCTRYCANADTGGRSAGSA